MAGDWIKMRTDLLTSPKVVRMASALKADRFRIAGGLLSVWSLFDVHSTDGMLSGYTLETVDDLAAWPGFSAAMVAVEWMIQDGESLVIPRFEAHNGASAKRRAQDSDRKREVRKMSASDADKTRTREEKRREEKKDIKSIDQQPAADLFDRFWKLYPNKKGKANAEKAWAKLKVGEELFNLIASGLAAQVASQDWKKDGGAFIPHPATWLNGRRWEDEVTGRKGAENWRSRHFGLNDTDHTQGLIDRGDGTYDF